RDVHGLQQFNGFGGRRFRTDSHQGPFSARSQEVPDRVYRLHIPRHFVFGKPGVVKKLAEVVSAGISAKSNHQVVAGQAARVAQGRRDGRAAGTADEYSFTPCQTPGHVKRLRVGNSYPVVDQLTVKSLGNKIFTNALDLPRLRRASG